MLRESLSRVFLIEVLRLNCHMTKFWVLIFPTQWENARNSTILPSSKIIMCSKWVHLVSFRFDQYSGGLYATRKCTQTCLVLHLNINIAKKTIWGRHSVMKQMYEMRVFVTISQICQRPTPLSWWGWVDPWYTCFR